MYCMCIKNNPLCCYHRDGTCQDLPAASCCSAAAAQVDRLVPLDRHASKILRRGGQGTDVHPNNPVEHKGTPYRYNRCE